LYLRSELGRTLQFGDLDPVVDPPRLVLSDGDLNAAMIDETLKGGTYAGGGTAGWTSNGKGTKWTYRDKSGTPTNGIINARIDDRSHKAPGRIRIKIKGRNGNYTGPGLDYVNVSLISGDPALGQCAETAFTAPDCKSTGNDTRFGCRD
jgi:hypothetical protein